MECGQCKDCKWWCGEGRDDSGDCRMSATYPNKNSGIISIFPGSLIAGLSLNCTQAEQIKVIKAIDATMIDVISIRTSRYFGCVMFEPED